MRALRAVWSPFGAHDQRKRPHKLPDQAVKELAEEGPPPGETAHYTHANPPIKRFFVATPGLAARPVRPAPRWCVAIRARGRSERGRAEVEGGRNPRPGACRRGHHGTPEASRRRCMASRTRRRGRHSAYGLSSQLRWQCEQSDRASPAMAPPWTENRPCTPRPTARLAGA